MKISLKLLNKDVSIPEYKTPGSSGFDISAYLKQPVKILPQSFALIQTGIAIQLPQGFEAQVRSRSGLAAKNGIFVLNSPGTIDNDYRGELAVILANFSTTPFIVENEMRIAQVVIARYHQFEIETIDVLEETVRGTGGFGSTGLR